MVYNYNIIKYPPTTFKMLISENSPRANVTVHTQYTHSTHTVHTQYTHSTHTVHTQYTHSTHTVHTQYTHSTHTVHTQYTHSTHTVHTQYTHSTHTVHTQYTKSTQRVHKEYTKSTQEYTNSTQDLNNFRPLRTFPCSDTCVVTKKNHKVFNGTTTINLCCNCPVRMSPLSSTDHKQVNATSSSRTSQNSV